jgi:hypothetical protein
MGGVDNLVALSKKMAAYLRRRLGKSVPVYREIVLWDDGTFQVKVVHTFDAKGGKMRVYLMYTSSRDEYVLIEGRLDDYAAEAWHDTTVAFVPSKAMEG